MRLTNAFSKKLDNHIAAISLHFMYYNFVRIHQTLRVTPAMAAGVTDRVWEVADIVRLLQEHKGEKHSEKETLKWEDQDISSVASRKGKKWKEWKAVAWLTATHLGYNKDGRGVCGILTPAKGPTVRFRTLCELFRLTRGYVCTIIINYQGAAF
jgi:hypothetical protein